MRIPPIAALLVLAASGTGLHAADPAASPVPNGAVGVGADSTPGYYPTWKDSRTAHAPYGEPMPAGEVAGYNGTGWETGGVTMQYRPDLPTETAQLINPYLLRNETNPDGTPTFGHRVDDFLSPFVPQSAVWYGEDGRSSTRLDTNLGLFLQRDLDLESSQIKAGPLYIHFTQLDVIGLYSDISGPYAQTLTHTDRFISSIALEFEVALRLSPRTFFDAVGTVYYLPTKNAFGFYAGSGTATYAHLEHSIEIDRWDITFYDYLDVITPLSYLLQLGSSGAVFDRSGLYMVGFFSNGFDQAWDGDRFYLRNSIGMRASTFIKNDLRFTGGYEHEDIWLTNHFNYGRSLDHFNAGLFYEPRYSWVLPWTTYDAYVYDNFRAALHQWYVGATLPVARNFTGYARAGWAWNEGERSDGGFDNDGTFVWDVGFTHQIDCQWTQSAVFGNSYRIDPLLETTHGMYGTYGITFKSSYSSFYASGSFTYAHIEPRGDYDTLYTLFAGGNLTDRTSIRGTFIYDPADFGTGTREIWYYRAELDHMLTPTLTAKLIYQFTDYHTTQAGGSYEDNMIMFQLTKAL